MKDYVVENSANTCIGEQYVHCFTYNFLSAFNKSAIVFLSAVQFGPTVHYQSSFVCFVFFCLFVCLNHNNVPAG